MDFLVGGGWERVVGGESGAEVFRRGGVYAKCCSVEGIAELRGERDRVGWLAGTGIPGAEVVDWIESEGGAALLTTAVPGVGGGELPASRRAADSLAGIVKALHEVPVAECPFERRVDDVIGQAGDVVRRGVVEPDFLTDEWRLVPPERLLAGLYAELAEVKAKADLVVCHGDACLPNFLFDPDTLECTGMIDVGRLGIADRYADLALLKAQLEDEWALDATEFLTTYGLAEPDGQRLTFYRLLDSLSWASAALE
ncbi:phosphotransferase [Kribbella monticola]|uniref:phosphotransferase n=1 Tax=Kribbella monticola TaxID=2185285 RepID=UPI000DD3F561|nr:aminoglycoside 3'-phosphotransferase [Kribbella monticola]